MNHLEIEEAHLVGHSTGGAIGCAAERAEPLECLGGQFQGKLTCGGRSTGRLSRVWRTHLTSGQRKAVPSGPLKRSILLLPSA